MVVLSIGQIKYGEVVGGGGETQILFSHVDPWIRQSCAVQQGNPSGDCVQTKVNSSPVQLPDKHKSVHGDWARTAPAGSLQPIFPAQQNSSGHEVSLQSGAVVGAIVVVVDVSVQTLSMHTPWEQSRSLQHDWPRIEFAQAVPMNGKIKQLFEMQYPGLFKSHGCSTLPLHVPLRQHSLSTLQLGVHVAVVGATVVVVSMTVVVVVSMVVVVGHFIWS